jgi:hypothetical protein
MPYPRLVVIPAVRWGVYGQASQGMPLFFHGSPPSGLKFPPLNEIVRLRSVPRKISFVVPFFPVNAFGDESSTGCRRQFRKVDNSQLSKLPRTKEPRNSKSGTLAAHAAAY